MDVGIPIFGGSLKVGWLWFAMWGDKLLCGHSFVYGRTNSFVMKIYYHIR